MTVEARFTDDNTILVVGIKGKFDFSLLNDFRRAYSDASVDFKNAVIDLRGATTIDSSALGMLLNMQRYLKKSDGEIKIINCNKDILKIFHISHFNKKFTIE